MRPYDYAKMAIGTMMRKFKGEELPPFGRFHYHQGVFLSGVYQNYLISLEKGEPKEDYLAYIKTWVDSCFDEGGELKDCNRGQFDDMQPGILLYPLYEKYGDDKYKRALDSFMEAVKTFPRLSDGGFYHKAWTPHQMWLDCLYMAGPVCCEYGKRFNEPWLFDETYKQITLMRDHLKDEKSGLWYHAYDESRQESWADADTGRSPEFWGRSIGWVPVAILDDLELMPADDSRREELIEILKDLLLAIIKFQPETGMWYQVVDKENGEGNWPETSCTCLYTAAICRAVEKGYLDAKYLENAKKGYQSVIDSLKYEGEDLLLGNVCVGTGVGDYTHYINRPTSTNDLHGMGAFLLMLAQMDKVM